MRFAAGSVEPSYRKAELAALGIWQLVFLFVLLFPIHVNLSDCALMDPLLIQGPFPQSQAS